MGTEAAFWRARAQTAQLDSYIEALASLIYHPSHIQELGDHTGETISAFERLQTQIGELVREVPFSSRVNLIHRSLIPCYQRVFILDNLVGSILIRLRRQQKDTNLDAVQAGSLLSVESRRHLRMAFCEVVPSWDRRDWDLYDKV